MEIRTSTHLLDETPNCSVIQIDSDNDVTLFGKKLHNIRETIVDYKNDRALFFYKNSANPNSLNQDPSASKSDYDTVYLPINIAFDVFKAFKQVEDNDTKKLNEILERIRQQ